jgi:hypothetical protein
MIIVSFWLMPDEPSWYEIEQIRHKLKQGLEVLKKDIVITVSYFYSYWP